MKIEIDKPVHRYFHHHQNRPHNHRWPTQAPVKKRLIFILKFKSTKKRICFISPLHNQRIQHENCLDVHAVVNSRRYPMISFWHDVHIYLLDL